MVDRHADTASLDAARPARGKARRGVVVVYDGTIGTRWRAVLVDRRLEIGRGEQAEVLLDDASASRRHALIEPCGDRLELSDAGSAHGVFVNGARIGAGARALAAGDVVRVAASLLVVVDDVERHEPVSHELGLGGALVGGRAARQALEFCQRFANSRLSVLVLGATGTGKEVVAGLLHELSQRPGPMVSVNCAALPRELIESQLFGHRRGAFSGATEHHAGYFAEADGGTLFLDEIADLPLPAQAKLLRVLETHELMPLGAARPTRVDVRVLAATSHDVESRMRSGELRSDLYHRLSGVSLWLPSLRERNEELPLIAGYFLTKSQPPFEGPRALESAALELLLLHSWPGNVRELRQALFAAAVRAAARESKSIGVSDLELGSSRASVVPASTVAPSIERIVEALRRHAGNVSRAASELGAHRAQIYRALEEHGMRTDDFRDG
jgi:DNA-binding NtrC family response regulator